MIGGVIIRTSLSGIKIMIFSQHFIRILGKLSDFSSQPMVHVEGFPRITSESYDRFVCGWVHDICV